MSKQRSRMQRDNPENAGPVARARRNEASGIINSVHRK
jgi:hypothetical protein